MLLITIVMLVAFTTIFIYHKNALENNSSTAMHEIAHSNYSRMEMFFGGKDESKNYSKLSAFVIDINEYTRTYSISGFTDRGEEITAEQTGYINALINSVLSKNSHEGVLDEYGLRYYYEPNLFGKRIVLLDKSYEDASLKNLIVSFVIIGVIALVAYLLISFFVARIAVKPVEKSMNMQRQLVSDVSHELKTPITVIGTNADIVLSHPDSKVSDESKWLGYIKDETVRMSDLVSNMLYLAKADEETKKTVLAEIDLSNVAFEASLPFESVCFESGKSLEIDIAGDIFIQGDESSLKQLIVILLDNANKYSNDNGNIKLSLSADQEKAYISVFNTGEPIPKECIPHLFERFYRVDKSRSRSQGGSGLGLSIAKHIIELNEGSISVNSGEESGTVFTCSFKLLKRRPKQESAGKSKDDEFKNIHFD